MREQGAPAAAAPLEPRAAARGEGAVAGEVAERMRLADVVELLAGHVRLVERDVHGAFLATARSEPPTGNDTPRRIRPRSTSSTFSSTWLATPPILSSSNGSEPACLRRRASAIRGSRSETNDVIFTTEKPAVPSLAASSERAYRR